MKKSEAKSMFIVICIVILMGSYGIGFCVRRIRVSRAEAANYNASLSKSQNGTQENPVTSIRGRQQVGQQNQFNQMQYGRTQTQTQTTNTRTNRQGRTTGMGMGMGFQQNYSEEDRAAMQEQMQQMYQRGGRGGGFGGGMGGFAGGGMGGMQDFQGGLNNQNMFGNVDNLDNQQDYLNDVIYDESEEPIGYDENGNPIYEEDLVNIELQ